MVLYTIKNLLPIKDILKTLPSSGINNYIKILQRQCSRKTFLEIDDNRAKLKDNSLEGKFVSKNVINLSQRQLTKSEISLLSKGLKFVPTPNRIDKAKLKQELEVFGRKLRLMWHFRNDERIFDCNTKFRPKFTFNPKNKDVIIETYLSSLEEKLLDIDIPKDKFNNLGKEERDALYSLKNDNTVVIKVLTRVLRLLFGTGKIT